MDIAMLILSIISTLMAIGSFIVAVCVKKEAKEIKNSLTTVINLKDDHTEIYDNSGVVADKVSGGVTINGQK